MRKQLVIKGHETRGKEVIEILQMLGARNKKNYTGSYPNSLYILTDNDIEIGYDCDYNNQEIFKLEDFLRKYPFKIGDKVINDNYRGRGIIKEMVWDSNAWEVKYRVNFFEDFGVNAWCKHDEIKLSNICLIDDADPIHVLCENLCENKLSMLMIDSEACKDEVEIILNDYEIVTRDGKTYAVKKKPKHPTTYEECCKIMGIDSDNFITIRNLYRDDGEEVITDHEDTLIDKFGALWELIICRDAYWKIADNWKPDWNDNYQKKWIINFYQDEINLTNGTNVHFVLAFPTREMRDEFYENFKDLIIKCKELL